MPPNHVCRQPLPSSWPAWGIALGDAGRAPNVMTGLGPVTHDFLAGRAVKAWVAEPSPAMTPGARSSLCIASVTVTGPGPSR